jgi:prepilin-type N-terminal cleavage/methylation domain-containing protein/prepilin-type processing-associated H-X9-DG protein
MRHRRGFTLLEMIIAFAIMSVLISILMIGLKGAYRSGLNMKCLSNMRQLQLAHVAYQADNEFRFINADLGHGGVDGPYPWIETLEEHYSDALVVHSPLDHSDHWPADQGGRGVPVGGAERFRRSSYGINDHLTTKSQWLYLDPNTPRVARRLTEVDNPAATVNFLIMAYEGEFAGSDHTHINQWWSDPPVVAQTQAQINAAGGRPGDWNAMSNYSFLDGHVATMPFHEVYMPLYDFDGDGDEDIEDAMSRFDPSVSQFFDTQLAQRRTGAAATEFD